MWKVPDVPLREKKKKKGGGGNELCSAVPKRAKLELSTIKDRVRVQGGKVDGRGARSRTPPNYTSIFDPGSPALNGKKRRQVSQHLSQNRGEATVHDVIPKGYRKKSSATSGRGKGGLAEEWATLNR